MSNFREIAQVFLRNEAAMEVRTPADVAEFAAKMIEQPELQRWRRPRGSPPESRR
jgi:hypothetical protein